MGFSVVSIIDFKYRRHAVHKHTLMIIYIQREKENVFLTPTQPRRSNQGETHYQLQTLHRSTQKNKQKKRNKTTIFQQPRSVKILMYKCYENPVQYNQLKDIDFFQKINDEIYLHEHIFLRPG